MKDGNKINGIYFTEKGSTSDPSKLPINIAINDLKSKLKDATEGPTDIGYNTLR